jgi:hypothetical protein
MEQWAVAVPDHRHESCLGSLLNRARRIAHGLPLPGQVSQILTTHYLFGGRRMSIPQGPVSGKFSGIVRKILQDLQKQIGGTCLLRGLFSCSGDFGHALATASLHDFPLLHC